MDLNNFRGTISDTCKCAHACTECLIRHMSVTVYIFTAGRYAFIIYMIVSLSGTTTKSIIRLMDDLRHIYFQQVTSNNVSQCQYEIPCAETLF